MEANMNAISKVPFYGNKLITVEQNGEIYVGMKSIVEGMGLAWQVQARKITSSARYNHMVIPFETVGGKQDMIFLPLKKLNGWLFSINADKCRPDIRQKVKTYQEECFQVLYEYFNNGGAVNRNINQGQLADLLQAVASTTAHAVSEAMGNKILEIAQQVKNFEKVVIDLQKENALLKEFSPQGCPGEISKITGLPKDRYVRGYFTSNKCGNPIARLYLQLELPLEF
jgi:hypothetical protein